MILRTRNSSLIQACEWSCPYDVDVSSTITVGSCWDKGCKELSRRELTPGVLSDSRSPSSSLGGMHSKLSSSECIFFALNLRCPVRYSAWTKTKRKLFCSSTSTCSRHKITHLNVNFNHHFLDFNFQNILRFNSRLPIMQKLNLVDTNWLAFMSLVYNYNHRLVITAAGSTYNSIIHYNYTSSLAEVWMLWVFLYKAQSI